MNSTSIDIGKELAALRTATGLKQSDIARALGIHTSAVSRIETSASSPEPDLVESYIKALGTKEASDLKQILDREWSEIPRPSSDHPNLPSLIEATDNLDRLKKFLDDPNIPKPLEGQARLLRDEVLREGFFLSSNTHSAAYIGDIGVGKTTAACFQAGLHRQVKAVRDLKEDVLLATGAGRTTICEVRARSGDQLSIIIEPLPDEEIYRLVAEFAADLWDRREGKVTAGDDSRALTTEIDRALRNMTGIRRKRERDDKGQYLVRDEAVELAREMATLEDLRSAIAERLKLFRRTTKELHGPANDVEQGKVWLRETFAKINDGRYEGVSLPHRLIIVVPFSLIRNSSFSVEVVDTKGIDQTAVRPDIRATVDDVRCVSILCSRFGDAPGTSINLLLSHLRDSASLRAVEDRAILLVLDRNEEARAMRDDETGADVQSIEEGRLLKKIQIDDALAKAGVNNLPVVFFNTLDDDPQILNDAIKQRIQSIRSRRELRLKKLSLATDTMFENLAHEHALSSQRLVNRRIGIFIDQNAELRDAIRRCQDSLLEQLRRTHVRTLWASMRRGGSWPNFDVHYWVGAGAGQDARLRTNPNIQELRGLINNMLGDEDLRPAHAFREALKSSIDDWSDSFLDEVRNLASEVFRPALIDDTAFWSACENEWGKGGGYRDRVFGRISSWFEDVSRQPLHKTLDQRMRRAWTTVFITPLREAINAAITKNDELA